MTTIQLNIELEKEAVNRIENGMVTLYVKDHHNTVVQMYKHCKHEIQKIIDTLIPNTRKVYPEDVVCMTSTIVLPSEVFEKGGAYSIAEVNRYKFTRLMIRLKENWLFLLTNYSNKKNKII